MHYMKRLFVTVSVLAVISGCASAPTPRFFTVDMHSSGQVKTSKNIKIDRIMLSQALIRPEIMIRTSPTEIEYYAKNRWVSRLDEIVTEKLQAEFGERIEDAETVVLFGTLLAFEQIDIGDSANAHIKLQVAFRKGDLARRDEPSLEKTYDIEVTAKAKSADEVVKALSTALEQIAGQIAKDANAL